MVRLRLFPCAFCVLAALASPIWAERVRIGDWVVEGSVAEARADPNLIFPEAREVARLPENAATVFLSVDCYRQSIMFGGQNAFEVLPDRTAIPIMIFRYGSGREDDVVFFPPSRVPVNEMTAEDFSGFFEGQVSENLEQQFFTLRVTDLIFSTTSNRPAVFSDFVNVLVEQDQFSLNFMQTDRSVAPATWINTSEAQIALMRAGCL